MDIEKAPPQPDITISKWKFLEGTFLSNARRDASPRGGRRIYKRGIVDKDVRVGNEFLSELRRIAASYASPIDEETHIANINSLVERLNNSCADLLEGDQLVFGIAQKLINSYLKYLWCVGYIPRPPH